MRVKEQIKRILDQLPYIKSLKRQVDFYQNRLHVLPGHFYSPIISVEEIQKYRVNIFKMNPDILYGIDLNEREQLRLVERFTGYYQEMPFRAQKQNHLHYFFDNTWYTYSDAIFLYSMIRFYKPKRIVEIGSGFSSAVICDTNKVFFNNEIKLTCIDPNPERLESILAGEANCTVLTKPLQEIDLDLFDDLDENDIVLVDSSHIVKAGSDVNIIIFDILPKLKKGVKIHFHDIFYPFQYPEEWFIKYKRSWNEPYFLRAFLMYNKVFKIIAFNTYLELFHREWFEKNMPLCLCDAGGSLWLNKQV